MLARRTSMFAIIALMFFIVGCAGVRYSEVSPDAAAFHPKTIAVLPADVTLFPKAKGIVDNLFVEVLSERKWFKSINGGRRIAGQIDQDQRLRRAVTDYLAKFMNLGFSDQALSDQIGSLADAEAFLIPQVDYWNYTIQDDKKVAKAGISITMIDAKTGKTVWKATHSKTSQYLVLKPDIAGVAKDLIYEMTAMMPH